MNINDQARFNQFYQAYLNELTLQGKSPKTVDMYNLKKRFTALYSDECHDKYDQVINNTSLVQITTE